MRRDLERYFGFQHFENKSVYIFVNNLIHVCTRGR